MTLNLISEGDQKRARNVQKLLDNSELIGAFDGASIHLFRIYQGAPDSAMGNLAWLACDEVQRGFTAALTEDESLVMNSCRRLMELTVLASEWRFDPARMEQWLTTDIGSRARLFKFGNITDRLRNHYGYDHSYVLREKAEFVHHSQWIHVVPHDNAVEEMPFVALLEELVGHTNAVMREIGLLMEAGLDEVPDIEGVPPGAIPDLWIPAIEWRAARQEQLDAALGEFGVHINRSPMLPRTWDHTSLLADNDDK